MGRATGLFSTAWDAYMEQPWTIIAARIISELVGVAFIVAGAGFFLIRALQGTAILPPVLDVGLAALGVVVAAVTVTVLRTGLIAVLYDVLEGRETGWRRMVAAGRARFQSIIGAYLIMVAILAVAAVALLAPALILFALDVSPLLGFVLGVVGVIVLLGISLFFLFIDQAVIIHGVGAREAVRESIWFVRARYVLVLKLFGIMVGLSLAVTVLPYVGSIVSSLVVIPVARLAYTRLYLDEGPLASPEGAG